MNNIKISANNSSGNLVYGKGKWIHAHRIVARGDAYPDSDLDFYILLENGQKKKFRSETREGIFVEYKYADVNQILVNFKTIRWNYIHFRR